MKAKELAEQLLKHPDFDLQFNFIESEGTEWGLKLRSFDNIHITDIGHSDKVIILGGKED